MTSLSHRLFCLIVIVLAQGCVLNDGICEADPADPDCCRTCQSDPAAPWCEQTCAEPSCNCAELPDAGLDAGQPDAGPCGVCSDTTPLCRVDDGECVACLSDDECGGQRCDMAAGECVECLSHVECGEDPTKPICLEGACSACTADAQCEELDSGHDLCRSGSCVECTAMDRTACEDNVCDGSTNSCTTRPANSKGLCQDCIADDECMDGQLCVPMEFGGTTVGNFCLWRQDASEGPGGSCTNVRPYAANETLTSIDGANTTVCSLALTTCTALNQFRMEECTTGTPPTEATDNECGIPDLDDGLCRVRDSTTNRCTTPCGSDDDCLSGFTCNTGASPRYCNF